MSQNAFQVREGGDERRPFYGCKTRVNPGLKEASLNVQVLHVQRVLFDELAPRFDVFAH